MSWLLVFHILGLIVWMGSLLDLTRILGYHVKEEVAVQKRLSLMEKRMYFFVATTGLAVTLIFGIALFFMGGGIPVYLKGQGWFHAKLLFVALLIGIHVIIGKEILKLAQTPMVQNPKRFKMGHGISALLLILVLIMVLVRPF